MSFPSPDDYKEWRDWARAAARVVTDSTSNIDPASLPARGEVIPPSSLPAMPEGYRPVWPSEADAQLFLGNAAYDPPAVGALFQVDTANLAEAAVELQKIADGAVDTNKLLDLAVVTAKIMSAAIISALIGDA